MPASWIERIMPLVLLRTLLLLVMAVGACNSCNKAEEPEISHTCKRAFAPTLDAYEDAIGSRVPAKCRWLDRAYAFQVISSTEEMAALCHETKLADNEEVTGCFSIEPPVVYVFERSHREMTDTAIHEWLHIILQCSIGNPDFEHMQGKLWYDYLKDKSAEFAAQTTTEAGLCL